MANDKQQCHKTKDTRQKNQKKKRKEKENLYTQDKTISHKTRLYHTRQNFMTQDKKQ